MAAISLYSKGTTYLKLRVTGLQTSYAHKRTYLWYIATSGTYKPNNFVASGTDSATNQGSSPVVTLSGLSAYTYYYVWCDIILEGETSPTTTLTWSGYTESDIVYIYAKAGSGVSSFDLTIGSSTYTVSASDGQISHSITSGTSVNIGNVTPKSGYGSPYNLYYNTESDPYGENGPKQFTNSVTISGTDFTRRLTVTASKSVYAFTTRVLIDNRFVKSTTDNSNTESSVTISSLPLYEQYADSYDFSYALVDEESIERPSYWRVPLRTDSIVVISLYFATRKRAVTPSIVSISTTAHEATISWSKQGATEGQWILYYGTSTSQMSSILITSSPCIVSDLLAAKTYLFRIRHYISSSDHADSDYVSSDTKYDIPSFSWTTDDAANIVAGQPVTKLTATAWNKLKSLITQCGGNSDSVPTAYPGSPITANAFNAMRNSIASLAGAGDVTPSVTANTTRVEASKFANAYSSLKEAINRAITAKNS